jgi:hypothetical protein
LVGNDAGNRFTYKSLANLSNTSMGYIFGYNFNAPGWNNGVSIVQDANPDISWETAKKTDFRVEVNLFNKLEMQADYSMDKRENILMDRNVSDALGLQVKPQANVGSASSKAFEFSLNYDINFNKDLWLTATANYTWARGEFDKYEEPAYANAPWKIHTGQSIKQQWGYVAERLFVDDAEALNSPPQFGTYPLGGDIKYRDINGDGQINSDDQVPIGFPTDPEIIYGFGFSSGYKIIDVSCFFQGSAKSSFWIDPSASGPFTGNNELLKVWADSHWSETNQNVYALWPRLSTAEVANNNPKDANNKSIPTTWFMQDGAFLRLKSVEVGITLPKKWISKAKFEKVRIYANGTNLWTYSAFKLWDVEMGGNGLAYPVQKVINFGVQASF